MLSWRWYTAAVVEIWTCDVTIANPALYHTTTSAALYAVDGDRGPGFLQNYWLSSRNSWLKNYLKNVCAANDSNANNVRMFLRTRVSELKLCIPYANNYSSISYITKTHTFIDDTHRNTPVYQLYHQDTHLYWWYTQKHTCLSAISPRHTPVLMIHTETHLSISCAATIGRVA